MQIHERNHQGTRHSPALGIEAENEFSLDKHLRIFSAYNYKDPDKKIWVITEADRSVSTVLFPDEY